MFRIYKNDSVIVEGESPLVITGLDPNTEVSKGEYQVVRLESDRESNRVDIPAFTTLPISVTGVTISPRTSTATAGESGSRQLTATIEPENATNKNVTFETENVEGLSVSQNGLLTWTENTPAGIYTTTVTTEDGEYTATHTLTLEEPEPEPEEGD